MLKQTKYPNVSISPGFLLLIGMLIYLDDGIGIFPWVLLSAIIHELGHIAVSAILGGRVAQLTLGAVGAELRFNYSSPLTYGKESLIALAGPGANALLGIFAILLKSYLGAAISFGLGVFNLLPVIPLDGGWVLFNFISEWINPMTADRIMAVAAAILIGFMTGIGAIMALNYANIMLLVISFWLLFGFFRKKNRFS